MSDDTQNQGRASRRRFLASIALAGASSMLANRAFAQFSALIEDGFHLPPGPWNTNPDAEPLEVPPEQQRPYGLFDLVTNEAGGTVIGKLVDIPPDFPAIPETYRGSTYIYWDATAWPQSFRLVPTTDRTLATTTYDRYEYAVFGAPDPEASVHGSCYLIELVQDGTPVGYADRTDDGVHLYAQPDSVGSDGTITVAEQGLIFQRIADHPTDLHEHRQCFTTFQGSSS